MGMYTEFHFNVELKENTPQKIINLLRYMTGQDEIAKFSDTPDHPLFQIHESRWKYMLRCDSYYFPSKTASQLFEDHNFHYHYLNIKCNVKNYNNEIQHFLNWICPYVESDSAKYLGHYAYEESRVSDPVFIFYESVPDNCKECGVTLQQFGSGMKRNEESVSSSSPVL